MAEMIYCVGDDCPIANLCARFVRVPGQGALGWDTFTVPPWSLADRNCMYFWPEGRAGLTDLVPSPSLVTHMGGGESENPSGTEQLDPNQLVMGFEIQEDALHPTVGGTPVDPVAVQFEKKPDGSVAMTTEGVVGEVPIVGPTIEGTGSIDALPEMKSSPMEGPPPPPADRIIKNGFGYKPTESAPKEPPSAPEDWDGVKGSPDMEGIPRSPLDKPLLWTTAEEQTELFQKIVRTEEEIYQFEKRCRELKMTSVTEVWALLNAIKDRMHRITVE